MEVPFNRPYLTGAEQEFIAQAQKNGQLSGDGAFTDLCQKAIEELTSTRQALLTHSCTAALEMAAILIDIEPGDEIIMPSFTFVSTANAFVLRGAVPVFVDIKPDSLNLDERLIASALSDRTKAIVPVHYSGMPCEMGVISSLAKSERLFLIEDAAQALMSYLDGQSLGSFGDMATLSFHETKNISCGEGGALLINNPDLIERAQVIREKGTDRTKFVMGEVDRYTWQDIGSSFLPGELTAAFLYAQLLHAKTITQNRLCAWHLYHEMLWELEEKGLLERHQIVFEGEYNAHMYRILLREDISRSRVIQDLRENGVSAVSHYEPLHCSPAGKFYGRQAMPLPVTESISQRLLRLPLWAEISANEIEHVVGALSDSLSNLG